MPPSELHIYDVDDTLYASPRPPVPDPVWWYHAHSFGKPGAPGFDPRWKLSALTHARRSVLDPTVMTVVLTGRPDHVPMRRKVTGLLRLTGLSFDAIALKPVMFPGTTAQYKGVWVRGWLEALPSVRKVVFYDDQDDNLLTVGKVAKSMGASYKGYRAAGL